tara:strand:+ start:407 stop:691 length:285 start_codon:yes stop_codon:yes gene_type:complete
MLDDLSGQRIQLNLFTAALDQTVVDFSHPFRQGKFRPFFEEISAVELTVKLIHKIRTGQPELVEQFTQPSAGDVKAIVSARHQILVEGFRGRCG